MQRKKTVNYALIMFKNMHYREIKEKKSRNIFVQFFEVQNLRHNLPINSN